MSMLKKEKQRSGALVSGSGATSSLTSSPLPSTPSDDSALIGNRKCTVGEQSPATSREERTKNVIRKSTSIIFCVLTLFIVNHYIYSACCLSVLCFLEVALLIVLLYSRSSSSLSSLLIS